MTVCPFNQFNEKIRLQQTWNVIGLKGLSTWVTNVSAHIGLHVFFFSNSEIFNKHKILRNIFNMYILNFSKIPREN